jgi:hypothetical protein
VALVDAFERRLAHDPVPRPATDLGADHELRLHPRHESQLALPLGRRVERCAIGLERGEAPAELRPPLAGEPRTNLPREPERIALVDADCERAQVLGVALARCPATDDELLLGPDLDLEPRRRPAAGLVRGAAELRDDALETALARGLVERPAVTFHVRGEAHPGRLAEDAPEKPLPILERDPQERAPVEVQEIERLVQQSAAVAAGRRGRAPAARRARPARAAPDVADRLL